MATKLSRNDLASGMHIEGLPNEVLVEISKNLSHRRDLMNLRLASRLFNSIAIEQFGKVCFSKVFVALTKSSLKKLVQITSNPTFARHVSTV